MFVYPLHLPRYAFSLRDVARAGDIWRAFQELAINASNDVGWTPVRYRESGSAFVVNSMTVVHESEVSYGMQTSGSTWISDLRKDLFSTRQVRIHGDGKLIAKGSQQWMHVRDDMKITRAPAELARSFDVDPEPLDVDQASFPSLVPSEEQTVSDFEFDAWFTWMDPLNHVNHPQYVDFIDEAIARAAHRAGFDPLLLVPIAEEITFKRGVEAGQRVKVESKIVGHSESGALMCNHRILVGENVAALAKTARRLANDGMGETTALRLS